MTTYVETILILNLYRTISAAYKIDISLEL